MRSGAAGSTRIASLPAMRMSCLRRRACADTGSDNGRCSFEPAAMSVELLAVARREHAVAVQQQHRDADEFLDLRERVLVVVVAVVLRGRGGQLRQVAQGFLAFLRQRRRRAGGQAEGAEEATTPVEEGAAA